VNRLIVIILLLTGCASAGPAAGHSSSPTFISGIQMVHDPKTVTGHINSPCHTRDGGQLPDPICTPGAVDPTMTKAKLCAPGFSTINYRPSSAQTNRAKFQIVLPAYDLSDSFQGELDHLIPLEIGGANDLSNLWPEAGKIPNPKDKIENELRRDVCAGTISLAEAQADIAQDWTQIHG
jgi:hypothetical protein